MRGGEGTLNRHTVNSGRNGGFLVQKLAIFGHFLGRKRYFLSFSDYQFWSIENIFWLPFLVPEKLLIAISGQKKITTVHEGVKFSKPEMKYFWQFSGEKLPILVGRKYFLVLFLVKEK